MGQIMNATSLDQGPEVLNADEFLARCMGHVEFASRVLAKFQNRLERDLEQLETDLAAGNTNAIVVLAHRMKGASANVAAPQLQHCAAEIERLARDARTGDISSELEQLRHEWSRFADSVSLLGWVPGDAC
jgi:HPt (histidine-containing phosphotransfer) domain-containing protein